MFERRCQILTCIKKYIHNKYDYFSSDKNNKNNSKTNLTEIRILNIKTYEDRNVFANKVDISKYMLCKI